jgi:hypothetical protein
MRLALFLALLALFAACPLAAQHVGVRAGARVGRGLTYLRGAQCFVITPKHVVDDADDVEIIGAGSNRATARLLLSLPQDIAILRVTSGDTELCAPWPQYGDIDAVLASARDAMLRSRSEHGGSEQLPVYVTGFDFQGVDVRPVTGEIHQGMSGSAVVVGSTTTAMLLEADAGSGSGRAIRVDRIEEAIVPYLGMITQGGSPLATYQDSLCISVKRLVASAQVNFSDLIGEPTRFDGVFESTLALPRLGSGIVNPQRGYFALANGTASKGQAEAFGRRTSYAVGQCFPDWIVREIDKPGEHYFVRRNPTGRTRIDVSYQTTANPSYPDKWYWVISVWSPTSTPDVK